MEEIRDYIKERIGGAFNPYYNLFTWQQSTLVAGFQTVSVATKPNEDVQYFYIKQIAISTDGLGGTIDFIDTRFPGVPIFSILNIIPYFDIMPFEYISNNTKLNIVTNSATVKFSLAFMTVSPKKKEKQ